ncbi:hypothetical protein B0H14DRAFT_3530839 [Mycena olivaceomarginata]|nr:hypothetical protein B0H14DRAFT_3530839 [Mycena olivaceomarginata]
MRDPVASSPSSSVDSLIRLMNGLFGHRFYCNAHPRRRLIIKTPSSVMVVPHLIPNTSVGYWYTRTPTAFIGVSGTLLIASSNIIVGLTASTTSAQALN